MKRIVHQSKYWNSGSNPAGIRGRSRNSAAGRRSRWSSATRIYRRVTARRRSSGSRRIPPRFSQQRLRPFLASALQMPYSERQRRCSSVVEQLIRNQQVAGSSPAAGSSTNQPLPSHSQFRPSWPVLITVLLRTGGNLWRWDHGARRQALDGALSVPPGQVSVALDHRQRLPGAYYSYDCCARGSFGDGPLGIFSESCTRTCYVLDTT